MDRPSWLWRRRSSEKSSGETESSGGSLSSHSERFSDDQVYLNQSSQSPEITSKAEQRPEEIDADDVKTLSEKLSAALMNISSKEELVKQHAKVAEEAVEGWEKAENEVFALRQQVEVLTLHNSTLEDRVGHLDGALKECLRQLRQTREEKDQNALEATKWQATKSQLENRITDLSSQLRSAKTETPDADLCSKLELAEKQNSALKLEVSSMAEELEIRLIERELSNQAAEQASKLHLESIKKATKFEAECRRLTSALRKVSNEHRSFTDSQSDTWEQQSMVDNEFESNRTTPSIDISLMDDFLEMERLVALPENDQGLGESITKTNSRGDDYLKSELEAMINRTSELEEMLKKVETEKVKLEIALNQRENEVKMLRNRLESAESELAEMGTRREATEKELESSRETLKVLERSVKRAETEAAEAQGLLDDTYRKKEEAESRCKALEAELESWHSKVESLEREAENERGLCGAMKAKCRKLEGKISRLQSENQHANAAKRNAEVKIKQDTELAMAGSKFAECQKTISSLRNQLKTLSTLEELLIDS